MAYSRAHAAGLWQFIPSTARIFGLKVDRVIDERRDLEKSTRAACAYLRRLHDEFGSWDLALAAYNCGERRIRRAIERHGTRDYWALDLPTETENYVPKIYAALMVVADPDFYGIHYSPPSPSTYRTVELPLPVDLKRLARQTGVSYQDLKAANPELLTQYTPPGAENYPLRIPTGQYEQFIAAFDAVPEGDKYLTVARARQLIAAGTYIIHVVRRGDSLWTIARRYDTTVAKIRRWNRLGRRNLIRPGQRLKIYRGA